MRALVSGSAGFLGRHFVRALNDKYKTASLDIAYAAPFGVDALEHFQNDGLYFDLVIHCAAVHPHRAAIDNTPLTVGAGNLELDAAMFGWAARTKPGRVVYFSSSAAYPAHLQGARHKRSLVENDIGLDCLSTGTPDAIYGWTKLTGELLADAYRRQGGAVTVLRPFSGYGEDQSADFPFGAFVRRAQCREDPFVIWGDGDQVRDWIHVDDVVAGTLAAAERGADGPLNLCTGAGTSMEELAELFCAAAGYRPELEFRLDAPSGVAYRVGDPTRMLEVYQPRVSLEEGVKRALEAAHA